MNLDHFVDRRPFGRTAEPAVLYTHGMQDPFEFTPPMIQERAKFGKERRQVVFLPDKELEERRMIRPMAMDFRGGETIVYSENLIRGIRGQNRIAA